MQTWAAFVNEIKRSNGNLIDGESPREFNAARARIEGKMRMVGMGLSMFKGVRGDSAPIHVYKNVLKYLGTVRPNKTLSHRWRHSSDEPNENERRNYKGFDDYNSADSH